jgi:hypothetical protein
MARNHDAARIQSSNQLPPFFVSALARTNQNVGGVLIHSTSVSFFPGFFQRCALLLSK